MPQKMHKAHHHFFITHQRWLQPERFPLLSISIWKSVDIAERHSLSKQSEGFFCSYSQQFLPNQMMCASCHVNIVCKQCDREKGRQTEKGKERARPPQALLLLASPGIFSVKLFADSLWSWVPGPAADDGCPPQSPYTSWTPLAVGPTTEVEGRRKTKSRTTQSDMNTGWQPLTGGNTTPFSTRFAAHSTQMESGLGERERTDGQTHKQRADSTPHSQSQSHYRELGSRDWRCNDNTFWMPFILKDKVLIQNCKITNMVCQSTTLKEWRMPSVTVKAYRWCLTRLTPPWILNLHAQHKRNTLNLNLTYSSSETRALAKKNVHEALQCSRC